MAWASAPRCTLSARTSAALANPEAERLAAPATLEDERDARPRSTKIKAACIAVPTLHEWTVAAAAETKGADDAAAAPGDRDARSSLLRDGYGKGEAAAVDDHPNLEPVRPPSESGHAHSGPQHRGRRDGQHAECRAVARVARPRGLPDDVPTRHRWFGSTRCRTSRGSEGSATGDDR